MGCFFGCFGGAKDQKRQRRRVNRGSPERQRNRVQKVQQDKAAVVISEQPTKGTTTILDLVPELQQTKPEVVEQTSPSPIPSPKKVTFDSNITTYEHVHIHNSIESLPEWPTNIEIEKKHKNTKTSSQSNVKSSEENYVTSSVATYPPNHRYHNTRDRDDEAEKYDDSDLDNENDDDDDDDHLNGEYDEEDGYLEYEEDTDAKIPSHGIWSKPVLTESDESKTGRNPFSQAADEGGEVENSPIVPGGLKTIARDRSDYVNSVLNPVENIIQWKVVKSKGTNLLMPPPQKGSLTVANDFEPPRVSLSSSPNFTKKNNQSRKNKNQEVAVNASLSNWLSSPEATIPKKTSDFSGFEISVSGKTVSEGRDSVRSFEDRPILGALTVEELRQISITKSPRKSPSKSPDERPIIGTVGTYWNDSSFKNRSDSSSFKGIPNTTSKYREDKRVNWHSTPFETRLDRALLSQRAS